MRLKRGRPVRYSDPADAPALLAVRIPRPLEARLRQEAAEDHHTMTDILLGALAFFWDHSGAVDAIADTQKALARLEHQHAALEKQYTALEKRVSKLVEDKKALRRDLRRAEQERDKAQREEQAAYRAYADLQDFWARGKGQGGMPFTPCEKRELLKICHPDRWSQGQPATELAHEVMVRLNQ